MPDVFFLLNSVDKYEVCDHISSSLEMFCVDKRLVKEFIYLLARRLIRWIDRKTGRKKR